MSFDDPVVAVSQRVVEVASRGETRDCLDQEWTAWLGSLGFQCVPVPNRIASPAAYLSRLKPAGIILSGGNDLTLDVYDDLEPSHTLDGHRERDVTERALVEFSIRHRVALLACCRGMQFLHAYYGGRLAPAGGQRHVSCLHDVELIDDRFRRLAGGESLQVNSFHNYGIRRESMAMPLVPFALSRDSMVEGCFHADLPIVGIMWHPERRNPAAAFDRHLAASLFGSADDQRRAGIGGTWVNAGTSIRQM